MRDTRDLAQLRAYSQPDRHNAFQRVWVLLLTLVAIVFAFPQPGFTHSADQAYVVATFDADENTAALRIHVQIQLGPLANAPLWAEADRDQNDTLDPTEISAWLPTFAEQHFVLQVDDVRTPFQTQLNPLSNLTTFRSPTAQPQLQITLRAPVARGPRRITFTNQLHNQGGTFRADVASAAHAAFSPVSVDGNAAHVTLDTTALQPNSFWQRLLMLLGLGVLFVAVVGGVAPSPNPSPVLTEEGSAHSLSRSYSHSDGRGGLGRGLLALITLLATSNPTALPSFGVAAVGGCQMEPSAIWLKSNIEGGTPQQTVQVILPTNDTAAALAPDTGSTAIADTTSFQARVSGTQARIAQARVLAEGKLSLLVAVPPTIGSPVPRTISINTPYGTCTQTVLVAQATQWNVYISQFGHPDAGWCTGNTYAAERLRHVNNQIAALDQISATLSRLFDNRQRFEADNFWQFDEALKDNPARAAQFQQYIQQGYYGLNPIYAPLLVQSLDSESFLQGLLPYAHRERLWNLPKRTSAFLSEVPESTAGMPTLLNHAGITSFARGVLLGTNSLWGGAMPTDLEARRVFWWQGPDGSKVLARMQAEGAYFELTNTNNTPITYDDFASILNGKANTYENAKSAGNYPADAFLIFGTLFDCGNVDTSYKIGDFIHQWNNSVAFPKIIGGNQNEFFDYVAQNFGSQLPTYSGGFDTQWTDGLTYHATTTVQFRHNAIGLLTAQKLSVIANAPGASGYAPNANTWLDAIKDHLLYAEHSTLANDNACFNCALQKNLEQHRANLVRDVFTRTQTLQSGALNALTPNISTGASTSPEANPFVLVFNPLSWERSAAVTVTVSSTVPLNLTDVSTGNTLPSQMVAPNTLLFVAPSVPALGYKVFRLSGPQDANVAVPFTTGGSGSSAVIASTRFSITVDGATGGVSIYDKFLGRDLINSSGRKANQLVYNYNGTLQNNDNIATSITVGPVAATLKITGKPNAGNITGFTQTVTLFDGLPFVQFENALNKTVGNPNCTTACDLERIYFAYPINLSNTPQMRVESNGGITNIGTDIFSGAARDSYGVQSFANVADANTSVSLAMPDTTLVEFGGPRTHEKNTAQPASSEMLALAYLSDIDGGRQNARAGNLAFRFALAAHGNVFNPLQSVRLGWEQRTPPVLSRLPANQPGMLPGSSRSFGQINLGDVVLSALKPAEDGNGFIARFWNPSTTPQQVAFDLSLLGVTQGQYVDGLERPLATGGETFSFSGAGTLSMTAQSFATLRLMRGNGPLPTLPPPPTPTATPVGTPTIPAPTTTATPNPTRTPLALPTGASATPWPSTTPLPTATPTPTRLPAQTATASQVTTPTPTQLPTPNLRVLYMPLLLHNGSFTNGVRGVVEAQPAAPTVTQTPLALFTSTATPVVVPSTATVSPNISATATATAVPTQPAPPTQPAATPTTPPRVLTVLDDFNRADGPVGGSWLGFPKRFALVGNQLVQGPPAPGEERFRVMYFDKVLGATQEVGVQIGTLGEQETSSEIRLLLKWQGGPGSSTSAYCYAIEVQYEVQDKRVTVSFCDDDTTNSDSEDDFPLTLAPGDFFSARVDGVGKLQVFKNGVLVRTSSVADWLFVAEPGRPGLWIDDVPGTTLDNFSAE